MDDADPTHIYGLKLFAKELIAAHEHDLIEVCIALTAET